MPNLDRVDLPKWPSPGTAAEDHDFAACRSEKSGGHRLITLRCGESFQASKSLTGLNELRRWRGIATLLAVVAVTECAEHPLPPGLIAEAPAARRSAH